MRGLSSPPGLVINSFESLESQKHGRGDSWILGGFDVPVRASSFSEGSYAFFLEASSRIDYGCVIVPSSVMAIGLCTITRYV